MHPEQTALLPFDSAHVPEALKAARRWAPWRAVWDEKRKKWDKIPRCSTAKLEQWRSFSDALAALERSDGDVAGIGYCMTKPHGVIGIDLDKCVADGQLAPWAAEIVANLKSYTELSPSGNGLRIMGLGNIAQDWTNLHLGIETYGGHKARFLTITSQKLSDAPDDLQHLDPDALESLRRVYARTLKKAEVADLDMPDVIADSMPPDLKTLPLPEKTLKFLTEGACDGDRSRALYGAGVALYAAGLSDAEVFSALVANRHAMEVALDHRRQDRDRAMLYIWREHCVKARGSGRAATATADEFGAVAVAATEKPLPKFKRDGKGRIEATIENAVMAVMRADVCGMDIGFDRFRDEIMFRTDGEWQPFKDVEYVRLRIALERGGFKPVSRETIRDAALLATASNAFDSATLWLESLTWDGAPRVQRFLQNYCGVRDSDYVKAVSLYLWTALAGRALVPGIKADMVPVLIGEQGSAKSSSVAAIAPDPELFTEVSFHEREEDLARKMRGRLIAEISELRGLRARELESVKAFITRTHEHWVPKYREFAASFPRRLIFIGTTNHDVFLTDETGNRRWLPVRTGRIDVEAIKRDRLQLWAEGRELFRLLGVDYQAAEELAKDTCAQHTLAEPWAEEISRWLAEPETLAGGKPQDREFLRVSEVALGALRLDARQIGRREEMRIANALREIGYARVRKRVDSKPVWVWSPLNPRSGLCLPVPTSGRTR